MSEIVIQRDGDLDLCFAGELVGQGLWGDLQEYGVRVQIYRVEHVEPRYVVATYQQKRDGSEVWSAETCSGPHEVLDALRDEQGRIGAASKQAWNNACELDIDLAPSRYEQL